MTNTETTMTESLVSEKIAKMKNIPTKQDLISRLQKETLTVTFLKLDGARRVMTCTKSFDVIPAEHHPKTDKPAKEDTITVWDTNANAWRSFRYDRIEAIE